MATTVANLNEGQGPITLERFVADPARVNAVMNDVYERGDRVMRQLIGLHLLFTVGFAAIYETWLLSLLVGAAGGGMFFVSVLLLPRQRLTRVLAGISLQVFVALHIYQLHGLPEMHFFFFTAFTAMVVYQDGLSMWPGTILIICQHILFAVLQNTGVNLYFFEDAYIGVGKLVVHFGIAILQVVLCGAWAHYLRKQTLYSAFQHARLEAISADERVKSAMLDEALTGLKASQDALVRTEKLAAVGQLAASVGHELRNPLAAVRNANTYLGKQLATVAGSLDPKVPQFVALIDHEVAACTKIIADLLDFARARQPVLQPCPLRALVADACSVVPESNVRIVNAVPEDLPVPSVDKDHFRQVVINLVQNAVEAIPAGASPGEVIVSAEGGGEREWTLVVSDNGVGIAPDEIGKIFEPLFTTKAKGTGLGLAIVASMVKAHGGTIRVESQPGAGARFIVQIPGSRQKKAA
jgi:two-component system, NtrC family, sensor histidine kinase HydH